MDRVPTSIGGALNRHTRFGLSTLLIFVAIVAAFYVRLGNRARGSEPANDPVVSDRRSGMLHTPASSLLRELSGRARKLDSAINAVTRNGGHVMLDRPAGWRKQFSVGPRSERLYAVSFRTWWHDFRGELKCRSNEYGWNTGDRWLNDIEVFFMFETPGGPDGLKLMSCRAGDEVLRELAEVGPDLLVLDLCSPHVTDVGVGYLSKFTNLRSLLLCGASVTNDGVRALAKLNYLQEIYLDDTAVTDACLDDLLRLPRLISLGLKGTKVTPEGKQKARQLLESREDLPSRERTAQSAQHDEPNMSGQ